MMSAKEQVYAIKIVDFISKTEGPLYFEQVGIYILYWVSSKTMEVDAFILAHLIYDKTRNTFILLLRQI